MRFRRQEPKSPGGPPLSDKRAPYIELVSKGVSNSAACRAAEVNRRDGDALEPRRTISNRAGQATT
jgi:hypothetical protein